MKYYYLLYFVFSLIPICTSFSSDSEPSKANSYSVSTKYIDFTGQYNKFCRTNVSKGEE